eukprot:5843513-Pyramimonas_sp.AAC.1
MAEAAVNQNARRAMQTEWDRLRSIGTWDESGVMEYNDNSEFPVGHKDRKYNGRVVLDGSDVRDQNRDVALVQELSSSPATTQANKAADTYGLFDGHAIQRADAKRACTQSKLGGTPTWLFLPRDEWPPAWKDMRNPVCPLILSLYGHPASGGHREQHCEGHVISKGFI